MYDALTSRTRPTAGPVQLPILISVDCDPDRPAYNTRLAEDEVSWEGFKVAPTYLHSIRHEVAARTGISPVITWNVRADRFVKERCGSYDYCFHLLQDGLVDRPPEIDEIAWHHHQYRQVGSEWVHEYDDNAYIKDHIFESYSAIANYDIHTVHSGTCFQNTASMNAFNDVGLRVDHSAMPGMSVTNDSYNRYDYSTLSHSAVYIPSRTDYLQPDRQGENSLVEVPISTLMHRGFGLLSLVNIALKTRSLDLSLLRNRAYHLEVTIRPSIYRPYLYALFAQNPRMPYMATYCHADQLLSDKKKGMRSSVLYSRNNIANNILAIIQTARRFDRAPKFMTFRSFRKAQVPELL